MELALLVYIFDLLPALDILAFAVAVPLAVLTCILGFLYLIDEVDADEPAYRAYKNIRWVLLAAALITMVIPSKQTLYLMAGAYVTQSVVTSETGKRVVAILEQKIEQELANVEKGIKK